MKNDQEGSFNMTRKLAIVLMLFVLCSVFSIGHSEAAAPTQSILLTGVGNARELGGYKAEDGRTVRHGLLLRTAKLSDATEEDIQRLISEYHLAVIVDFRGDTEIENKPDPEISGVRNLNLQIIDEKEDPLPGEMAAEIDTLTAQNGEVSKVDMIRLAIKYGTFTDRMYVDFLSSDKGKAGYRRFFNELLDLPDGRAILFHCSEGKDRTGCAAMLILYALGSDEDTIMEDFLLTNVYNAALIEEDRRLLEAEGISGEEMETYLPMMDQVNPAYMAAAIAWMTETCGSPLGYIMQELGVTEEEIAALRNKFLE
jgi:protein-tyrosine phosphatase